MREVTSSGKGTAERITNTSAHKDAWAQTLNEMEALATDHEAHGQDVVEVVADDTAPEHPDIGDSGRYGLVHVVARNYADELAGLPPDTNFPAYTVYRTVVGGRVFLVTELQDPDAELIVLVASTYETNAASELEVVAIDSGTMYTHFQKLDGTHIISFRHDEPTKFFP